MSLKQDVIDVSKQILAEIPFNTIYSYADILFDAKKTHFGASSIQNQIDFLKNTTLSDIDYSDIEKNDFFTIKNCRTGKSIRVSNRRATNAELRAHILRALLEQKKQENPNNNLYDAITGALRTAKFSGPVTLLRRRFTLSEDVDENDDPRMSKEHFDLFITILLDSVKEKIKHKTLEENLEPKCIRDSEELLNKIWDGIDVDAIYDATGALTDIFQAIKHKADNLQSRGYQSEANLAYQLHKNLMDRGARLIAGKLSTEDFKSECRLLLENAMDSSLSKHRGFWGMIFHGILTVLNVFTFGAISTEPTQSIQTLTTLRADIDRLRYTNNEDDGNEGDSLGP